MEFKREDYIYFRVVEAYHADQIIDGNKIMMNGSQYKRYVLIRAIS